MKYFKTTVFQDIQRVKTEGARKPLRSHNEMAEEFSVKPKALSRFIALYNGPKPKLSNKGKVHCNLWYDREEMRAWWRARAATKTIVKVAA